MIKRTWAIVINTFLEASRNRAFIALGIVAIFFIMSSLGISQLALPDQRGRVLIDFGLFGVSIASLAIAIVLGVILIYKEVDKKTFYLIIPKPVRRFEIILGKFIGLSMVVTIAGIILSAVWLLMLKSRGIDLSWEFVKAAYLLILEVLLVLSIALFFSTFATPIISGLFTVAFFIIGRIEYILVELMNAPKSYFHYHPASKFIAKATLFLIPDLSVFHVSKQLLLSIPISYQYVLSSTLYALTWVVVFIGVSIAIFNHREFL